LVLSSRLIWLAVSCWAHLTYCIIKSICRGGRFSGLRLGDLAAILHYMHETQEFFIMCKTVGIVGNQMDRSVSFWGLYLGSASVLTLNRGSAPGVHWGLTPIPSNPPSTF